MAGRATRIGDAILTYQPDRSHRHEGAHRIVVAGRTILVRPDGRTTGRKRSDAIRHALDAASKPETASRITVEAVVGALILAGASNIEVDDAPLLDSAPTAIAVLRLEVTSDGTISVASIGGGAP